VSDYGMSARDHIEQALRCLDLQPGLRAGPSGVRAEAIAHLHVALLKMDRQLEQAIDEFVRGVLA
jgi:hypothetical protein